MKSKFISTQELSKPRTLANTVMPGLLYRQLRRFAWHLLPAILLMMAGLSAQAQTPPIHVAWSLVNPEFDFTSDVHSQPSAFECTPTVGDDGLLYIATSLNLYGVNPDGTGVNAEWVSGQPYGGQLIGDHGSKSSPSIGVNGNIYIGGAVTSTEGHQCALFSFSPFANLNWMHQFGPTDVPSISGGPEIWSTPAIAKNGNLVFGTDDSGVVFSENWVTGNPDWSFTFPTTTTAETDVDSSVALGPDGSVYYIGEHNAFFAALFGNTGQQKWLAHVDGRVVDINNGSDFHFNSSPAIDSDGTIYVGAVDGVFAMSPNGNMKWTFVIPFTDPASSQHTWFQSSPVIGPDGTIYIGASDGQLYALQVNNCEVSLKWKFFPSDWDITQAKVVFSTPAVASNGIVYVTMQGPSTQLSSGVTIQNPTWLFAVDTATGQEVWRLNPIPTVSGSSEGEYVSSSPTIGSDGTVYVADSQNLYAVVSSTSTPLGHVASSPWPMYQHDAKHTGNHNPLGMLAWWPAENNAIDIVGNHSGTVSSGVTFGAGEVGNCFQFNGTSGHVSVPASSDFDTANNPGFTIEGWIKTTTSSDNGQAIAEFDDGNNIGVQFFVNEEWATPSFGSGSLFASFGDGNGNDFDLNTGAGFIQPNQFYHVAVTYDRQSGDAKLYINGSEVSSGNVGNTFIPNTTLPLNIGYRSYGSDFGHFFQGSIDELAVFNRALTPGEINTISLAGSNKHMGKCQQTLDVNQ